MIVYEVNLSVRNEIAEEYAVWLQTHIRDMLRIDGFERADWLYEEPRSGRQQWSVRYQLASWKQLRAYLESQSEAMRAEAHERFGDGFEASRRVLFRRDSFVQDGELASLGPADASEGNPC